MTDDLAYDLALVTWLRAQMDEDERVAREASRRDADGFTPTGEHWHWVEPERDQVLTLDPMLDEYLNDGGRAALRSVEEYPTRSSYTLPHFVVSYAEEQRTIDAMHIARWDPARVLAEVEAKRELIDELIAYMEGDYAPWNEGYLKLMALPYVDRDGFRDEWRFAEDER